jgi:probable phosphoglycerate mutase
VTAQLIVLVRHGVTDWNREGRFQGHRDPPLAVAGRHEAALVAARLAADRDLKPARIVTSRLARAAETAAAIGRAVGVTPEADPRLIEIGQGVWEGRTHAELEVEDADRYRAWREASGIRQPPGGEPLSEATARIRAAVDDACAVGIWPICLVSHGGSLRIAASSLLALPVPPALDVDNASVSVLERREGTWHVQRWNDALHLLGQELTHVDEVEGRPLAF